MYFDLYSRINILISKELSRRSSIVIWQQTMMDLWVQELRLYNDVAYILRKNIEVTAWRHYALILIRLFRIVIDLTRYLGWELGRGWRRWRSDWGRNVITIPVDLYHNHRVEVTNASSTERGREHVILPWSWKRIRLRRSLPLHNEIGGM